MPAKSKYRSLKDLTADFKRDPGSIRWAGGSAGSTDQLLVGELARVLGADPAKTKYVAHSGGGEANAAILSGSVDAGVVRAVGVRRPDRGRQDAPARGLLAGRRRDRRLASRRRSRTRASTSSSPTGARSSRRRGSPTASASGSPAGSRRSCAVAGVGGERQALRLDAVRQDRARSSTTSWRASRSACSRSSPTWASASDRRARVRRRAAGARRLIAFVAALGVGDDWPVERAAARAGWSRRSR